MRRHPESGRGFTLIETLVALALLAVTLLFVMSLMAQELAVRARLDAHREALRALEVTLEAVRAGMEVPAGETLVDLDALYEREAPAASDLRVWTERLDEPTPGLFRLTVRARYAVGARSFDHTVETLVWRSGA